MEDGTSARTSARIVFTMDLMHMVYLPSYCSGMWFDVITIDNK